MKKKVTAPLIRSMKGAGQQVVCITAYDTPSTQIADAAGVDLILVGDSVMNAMLGHPTTLTATIEDMVHHTRAVAKANPSALIVADMPFGSFQVSVEHAVAGAIELVRAGAEAVKLEGPFTQEITAIGKAGIPVMGHVGMTPQSMHAFGGFKVQGKGDDGDRVAVEAAAIESAGAFAVVLELVPHELSKRVTKALGIPTIGIGAGPHCDGQVQVWHDLLGFTPKLYKHVKRYSNARVSLLRAIKRYASEVRAGTFDPGTDIK